MIEFMETVNDDNLISIGRMAEMSHLTVATLRLYDKLGLIKPKYKEEDWLSLL